ncbi:unnamed protein product [Sphagnum troendelagicum]|uniref:Uncharacterized protein n=1 Tax=Sphagnum troendelagicum TaxID=128251 RepID=A0ABP0UJ26_9BRYO
MTFAPLQVASFTHIFRVTRKLVEDRLQEQAGSCREGLQVSSDHCPATQALRLNCHLSTDHRKSTNGTIHYDAIDPEAVKKAEGAHDIYILAWHEKPAHKLLTCTGPGL